MNHTREAFIAYGVYLATQRPKECHDVTQRRTGQMSKNAFMNEPIGDVYSNEERKDFEARDTQ